ncbi:unnamed protein product, partial [Pylaiella littoralis]
DFREGDDEAWSPPSSKESRARSDPPVLRQTLPIPPEEWRRHCNEFNETLTYDGYSEEKLEWRNDANYISAPSCSTSGSTCSGTCSDDDDNIGSGGEGFRNGQAMAKVVQESGFSDGDGDDALVAAPVHASSPLLAQGPSPLNFSEQASTSSPSLSPEVRSADSLSPHQAGRRSGYLGRSELETGLSPQSVAVCRSANSDSTCVPSPKHCYHSSTAVHQPRARCGCRGLTVRVDSGPLGLSLEASYRMEQGFVLKQAWSDCAADSGMFTHSVHIENLPGKRDNGHIKTVDLGLKGESSSSGLIKVRRVGLESGGGTGRSRVLVRPPLPVGPGNTPTKEACSGALVGVLEVEQGDILVRVDDMQVTKKSFSDVITLLNRAERPTRLTFIRHACGRRFGGPEKGGGGGCRGATAGTTRQQSTCRWGGCCGKWGKAGCGCELNPRAVSAGPTISGPSPSEADGCPVAVLLRARRQLRSGGIEQWHEVVASRGQLWQRMLRNISPDSESDRAKIRKLIGGSRWLDEHASQGRIGIHKLKLMGKYHRLIGSRKANHHGENAGRRKKANIVLAARVWKDVNRTMSPRCPGGRTGYFSASPLGGGGHLCPAHFAGESKHAVFRVAYATASTLQFVSGMSYMAALMLVQEPMESMAYATLVTVLQEPVMRALFPLGDVDLLDAYHLCGGRVVNFCTPGAACSPTASQAASARRKGGGGQYPYRGSGYRCVKRGLSVDGIYASSSRDKDDDAVPDDGDTPRAAGWGKGEREGQQLVVGEMLPRLVRTFGKALKRRLPTLHNHLCEQAIPMSFLCAEWFTTAYARNTPLPLALCAFDLFLVRLDDVMLRLGLAVLEVLAPSLKALNGSEILLQYGGLTANVCFKEVLWCALATQ